MFQIKIFDTPDIEVVNKWLKDNPSIKNLHVSRKFMEDTYQDGTICNQWLETTLVYQTNESSEFIDKFLKSDGNAVKGK